MARSRPISKGQAYPGRVTTKVIRHTICQPSEHNATLCDLLLVAELVGYSNGRRHSSARQHGKTSASTVSAAPAAYAFNGSVPPGLVNTRVRLSA